MSHLTPAQVLERRREVLLNQDTEGELVARATVTTTGHAFTARSIQVFRIRDGKIVLFRDYFNPLGFEELLRD